MNKDQEVKVTFKKSELEILQSLLQDILDTSYHSSQFLHEDDADEEVGGDLNKLLNKIKKYI